MASDNLGGMHRLARVALGLGLVACAACDDPTAARAASEPAPSAAASDATPEAGAASTAAKAMIDAAAQPPSAANTTMDAAMPRTRDASLPPMAAEAATTVSAIDIPPEVSTHARDWPLPNADYDNTRRAPQTRIDSSTVSQLHEAWRVPLDGSGPFGYITSSVLVLGDTVYLQDMASNVLAIARDTGAVRWMHAIGELTPGPNGVAVGYGKVFADYGDTGVVALDAQDGSELWRWLPALVNSEGVDIQPLAFGGELFVSTVPASLRGVYSGGSRGVVHALAADSGEVRWRFDTLDSQDAWGDAAANGGGGAWYPPLIDAARGRVYWGTGNPLPWPGTTEQPSGGSRPGPNLYTSSLVALSLHDGTLGWYHQERAHDLFDWDFQNSPIRARGADGAEIVIGSGKTGTVVGLAADGGKLLWRAKVGEHENDELETLPSSAIEVFPGALGGVLSLPAYAEGAVFVPIVDMATLYDGVSFTPDLGNALGELSALDARDGHELWNVKLPAADYGAATVANDLVFTSDANGRVYAFARVDGREVWHYDAPGGINAPLSIAGDMLLVPVGLSAATLIALQL
jgi:outer membrane protein assembly factor BamB